MTLSEIDRSALERWLAVRLDARGPVSIDRVTALSTGYSAETTSFRAGYEDREGRRVTGFILRRESPDPAVYPQQAPGFDIEVDIQYRVMKALSAGTDVPLAPLVGYEADARVLGAPFFVMGFVEGLVPLVAPSYTQEGFFFDARPGERAALIEDGLRVLARLHSLDWAAHGLGWLLPDGEAPTAARQVEIWRRYTERELAGRVHHQLDRAFAWLMDNLPPFDDSSVTLNWGDPRPGNMIWRDFRCVCVTDFEAAAIAPFGVDLGWWLMFDRWSHESAGVARLPGEPTREEQAARYFDLSGRPPEPTHWYEVFAAVRYCAIVVRIMNRTVDRGLMPAGHDMWLTNQATVCLAELLPEAQAGAGP